MNRINPIYTLLLLAMIFSFFYFKISGAKDELQNAKSEYKETLNMANSLSSLKNIYDNKTVSKASLQRILRASKAAVIQKDKTNSTILSSESIDYDSLNLLMGKILNGSFNVTSLEIKKVSQESAKLYMEIQW